MKNQLLNSLGVLTREQAERILKPHLPNILESIRYGWKIWERQEERDPEFTKELNSTTRAGIVYSHIIAEARRRFREVSGVLVAPDGKYLSLVFEDRIVLRFKKLDDALYPSSIPTQHYLEYLTQRCFPGFERTGLIAGYRLDASETEIVGIHVICPVGWRRNEWVLDIGTDISTAVDIHQPQFGDDQSAIVRPTGSKERKDKEA